MFKPIDPQSPPTVTHATHDIPRRHPTTTSHDSTTTEVVVVRVRVAASTNEP